MSVLTKLGIAGFRSYDPQEMQFIEFFKPLTLICGANGSGKTTVIECLRLITTGKLPPNTNAGKTFVTDPLLTGKNESIGTIKLQFTGIKERKFIVSKTVQLAKYNKKGVPKVEYKSIQQSIKTRDSEGELVSINQHCADVQKQVPILFSVTPAILDYVIFCHQEESLWPFSNGDTLKELFDELFSTTKFTNAYEAMKEQAKQLNKEVKELQTRLSGLDALRLRIIGENKEKLMKLYDAAKKSQQLPPLRAKIKELEAGEQSEEILNQKLMKTAGSLAILSRQRETIAAEFRQSQSKNGFLEREMQNGQMEDEYNRAAEDSIRLEASVTSASTELQVAIEQYLLERNKQTKSHKMSILEMEIRQIKQSLPAINFDDETNSCVRVIRKLEEESKKLVIAREKYNTVVADMNKIGSIHCDVIVSEEDRMEFVQQKSKITAHLTQLEEQMKRIFQEIYQPTVQPKASKTTENFGQQIVRKEAVIEDRKKKLERYRLSLSRLQQSATKEKKHQSKADLQKQRERLAYVGIELQDKMLGYCKAHMKCHFCERSMSQSELKHVEGVCDKRKEKAQGMLRNLDRQIESAPEEEAQQDVRGKFEATSKEITDLQEELSRLKTKQATALSNQDQYRRFELMQQLDRFAGSCKITFKKTGAPTKASIAQRERELLELRELYRKYEIEAENLQRADKELVRLDRASENQKRKMKEAAINKERKRELEAQRSELIEQLASEKIVSLHLKNLRQIEATGSQKMLVDVGEKIGQVQPPSQKSSDKTKKLYRVVVEKGEEYEQLRAKFQSLIARRDWLKLQIRLKSLSAEEEQLRSECSNLSQLMQKRRGEYIQAKEEYTRIHTMVSDPEIRKKIQGESYNREFWTCFCELEAKKATLNEVTTTMTALDRALHGFHSDKMADINRLLKDTWEEVYHGKDIRNIQIKTNEVETSKKNTYNYNVVMLMEDGQEIDMRGRCSMGQKVLASVVIRLVLAEFFEGRCSILALDEPTTNLDVEHIHLLGQQLARLVASRRDRDNFQLIVISHDQQFIRQLSEFATEYYEVSRGKTFSVIKRQNIERLK